MRVLYQRIILNSGGEMTYRMRHGDPLVEQKSKTKLTHNTHFSKEINILEDNPGDSEVGLNLEIERFLRKTAFHLFRKLRPTEVKRM